MTIYQPGDKSKVICYFCVCMVNTTFRYRDVLLSESKIIVPSLLVGVCDNCDQTIITPAQSTPKIKQYREA